MEYSVGQTYEREDIQAIIGQQTLGAHNEESAQIYQY